MSLIKPILPEISEAERVPWVDALLELVKWQSDRIEHLEDEIQRLKQETRKPKFKSSKMDEQTDTSKDNKKKGPKRSKTQTLVIHEEQIIQPNNIPENARFKGYRDRIVQNLIIRPHTILYRLAEYKTDAGRKCRDTFASLKKTCQKQGISFWDFLIDRTGKTKQIPLMADVLQAAACG